MTQQPLPHCQICLNELKTSILLSNCNHTFCHSCISRHLHTLIDEGARRVENFKCPQAECQKQISETQLEKYMDFEFFNKLTNKTLGQYSLLCPECRTKIDIIGNLESWRCFNCYTRICKFCKATDHEGKCQLKSSYFNEVRTTIHDQYLGYCPQCVTPYLKDENCDHVTCQSPECLQQFCFFCSANYSPIYNHGGAYHRKDCRNYESWQGFQPYFSEGCLQCQKQQNINGCLPPTQSKQSFMKYLLEKPRHQQAKS